MALLNPYNYSKPKGAVTKMKAKPKKVEQQTVATSQDKYLEQRVMSASPEELTLMLYEGAVRFAKRARTFNDMEDIEKTSNALIRTQAIISELQSTLDTSIEISTQLDMMYDYILRRLAEANINKDSEIIDEAMELIEELKDTWKEAMESLK